MPDDRQPHPNAAFDGRPLRAESEDWADRDTRQFRWERPAGGPEMKTWEEGERPRYHDLHPLEEPPRPARGALVPGSRFSEVQWARAAYMIAAGCSMMQVAKTMGCTRVTVWRAYNTSPDLRVRIAWERHHLQREARSRIRSLSHMVAMALDRAVMRDDMTTVRWLADRLGVVKDLAKDDPVGDGADPAAFPEGGAPDEAEIAALSALPEQDRPYGYPDFHPDDTMYPLPADEARR